MVWVCSLPYVSNYNRVGNDCQLFLLVTFTINQAKNIIAMMSMMFSTDAMIAIISIASIVSSCMFCFVVEVGESCTPRPESVMFQFLRVYPLLVTVPCRGNGYRFKVRLSTVSLSVSLTDYRHVTDFWRSI